MNIIISPDSYKGSFASPDVSHTIARAFKASLPSCNLEILPMADGGEGTVDALIYATKGSQVVKEVVGPLGEKIDTYYGVLGDQQTVAVEVANTAGLQMVEKSDHPMARTSYGLGELLLQAMEEGRRHFIIGLGGSATTDGGMGMLQALGVQFLDQDGALLPIYGDSLDKIHAVDPSGMTPLLKECQLTVASDVDNPLCGTTGAAYIFGPQKGVQMDQLETIDQAMNRYATLMEKTLGKSVQNTPGAGAAGGLGFAFLLIGASLKSGAALVAEAMELEEKIKQADWVITGEGSSDYQTLYGKVPVYVAKLAKKHHKNTVLISGSLGEGHEKLYEYFTSCHSIISKPMALEEAMQQVESLLYDTAFNIANLIKAIK